MIAHAFKPEKTESRADLRREKILSVAKQLFLEQGYANASMNEISMRLGGSKATLYAYFKSKEELFEAIIRQHCLMRCQAFIEAPRGKSLRESLLAMARIGVPNILSDENIRMMSLVVAELRTNPQLGSLYFRTITENGHNWMAQLIQEAHEAGEICAPDAQQAAMVLKSLMLGQGPFMRLLGAMEAPTAESLEAQFNLAVDIFLGYYAPKP